MTTKSGAKLTFLGEGLKSNTPKNLKTAYRVIMGIVAVWAIVQPNFPEIPERLAHLIDRICLVGTPVFYAVCNMFGWVKPE